MKSFGFLGNSLLVDKGRRQRTLSVLDGVPLVALYFCADWCPPCKIFTPKLINFYHEINKEERKVEIVLISCDLDFIEYEKHINKLPWICVPYDKGRSAYITEKFDIAQIPSLVVLKWDGTFITKNGRDDVRHRGIESFGDWIELMVKIGDEKEAEEKKRLMLRKKNMKVKVKVEDVDLDD